MTLQVSTEAARIDDCSMRKDFVVYTGKHDVFAHFF